MTGKNARNEADVRVSHIVGGNLRRRREALGLSIRALATKVRANGHRTNYSSLTRIELGTNALGGMRAVTVDELVFLAEALEVRPEQLLEEPSCPACRDTPPAGFACLSCGTGVTA